MRGAALTSSGSQAPRGRGREGQGRAGSRDGFYRVGSGTTRRGPDPAGAPQRQRRPQPGQLPASERATAAAPCPGCSGRNAEGQTRPGEVRREQPGCSLSAPPPAPQRSPRGAAPHLPRDGQRGTARPSKLPRGTMRNRKLLVCLPSLKYGENTCCGRRRMERGVAQLWEQRGRRSGVSRRAASAAGP